MRKIAIVGAGYVGLVTGVCFAHKGNKVTIVEKDSSRINALLDGKIPFYEPGLDKLLKQVLEKETISFTQDIAMLFTTENHHPDIIFSCVGTPPLPDGSADLSFVYTVAHEIGRHVNDDCIVVNKSTVPIGTAGKVKHIIEKELLERNASHTVDVASNPEFLKEGSALNDFLHPDRVIVGCTSKNVIDALQSLYKPFLTSDEQFITMSVASAELTKYASNAMLATRISFMNQIALLADKVGADVEEIKVGMGTDKRIGNQFLDAGIGYGGSCFPKDVKALIATGRLYNQPMTLIKQVDIINKVQPHIFVHRILNHFKGNITQKVIGIWGLAFKPETDDIRCSPAIEIIEELLKAGAGVIAYDAIAAENMRKEFGNRIAFAATADDVVQRAHCLVVTIPCEEFLTYPVAKFTQLKDRIIFDGRSCLHHQHVQKAGITYVALGRSCSQNKDKASSEQSQPHFKPTICL